MNLDQYKKTEKDRYEEFANFVARELEEAIRKDSRFDLLLVQSRAKDPASLEKKLEKAGLLASNSIEKDIKDLAGCRLIFYTDSDVGEFESSGILQEKFKINRERSKIHYPAPIGPQKEQPFISDHFVVELKPALAENSAFKRFEGMLCEVQVQSILNHTWSYIAHDTIYKKPPLKTGFGHNSLFGIEERMAKIMREYLKPAAIEFLIVMRTYKHLEYALELFDKNHLLAIENCQDDDELYKLLEEFREYILHHFDDLKAVRDDIIKTVVMAVAAAQNRMARPIDTCYPVDNLDPIDDLLIKSSVAILDRLRNSGEEADLDIFEAIFLLYDGASSEEQRKQLIALTERLCKYSLDAQDQFVKPVLQNLLLQKIQEFDLEKVGPSKAIILAVLGEILNTEIIGESRISPDTIRIKTGAVVAGDLLVRIRSDAVDILFRIFSMAMLDEEKKAVLKTFDKACRTSKKYSSDALRVIVLNDTARIVRFMTTVSAEQSHVVLKEIEYMFFRYHEISKAPSMANEEELSAAGDELREAILAFQNQVNKDQRFVTFKILVGCKAVFPLEWERGNFDRRAVYNYRKEEIANLVSLVNEDKAEEWFDMISYCIKNMPDDIISAEILGLFFKKMGENKPEIILNYLERLDDGLAEFLHSMLCGLERSGLKEAAMAQARKWINKGRYVSQVIRYYCYSASTLDLELLEDALQAAIRADNKSAILSAVEACVIRYKDAPDDIIGRVFLPALRYLTKRECHEWVERACSGCGSECLFGSLAPEQAKEVLSSMVICPCIDYQAEQILAAIAAKSPEKVIDFFIWRQAHKKELCSNYLYDAIPLEFQSLLRERLRPVIEQVVASVRKCFFSDKNIFADRYGRLISAVFPEPEEPILKLLRELVRSGNLDDVEFVIEVLHHYQGRISLCDDIFKDIIEALPEDTPLLDRLSNALEPLNFGVSGHFGYLEIYQQQKDELESWLDDPREKIVAFARKEIKRLVGQKISEESRRADWDRELFRRT